MISSSSRSFDMLGAIVSKEEITHDESHDETHTWKHASRMRIRIRTHTRTWKHRLTHVESPQSERLPHYPNSRVIV